MAMTSSSLSESPSSLAASSPEINPSWGRPVAVPPAANTAYSFRAVG